MEPNNLNRNYEKKLAIVKMDKPDSEIMAKGNVYTFHREYVISKWGKEIIDQIENELSPKWSSVINPNNILVLNWIPHRFFLDLNLQFLKYIKYDHELLFKELGQNAVRQVVNKVVLSVLKLGTPNIFASVASTLWGRSYNKGKVILQTEKNKFTFILEDFNPGDKWTGLAFQGCLESYVELIGYKVVSSNYIESVIKGDSHEVYSVEWSK